MVAIFGTCHLLYLDEGVVAMLGVAGEMVTILDISQGSCLDWGDQGHGEEVGKEDEEEVQHCSDFFEDHWLTELNWPRNLVK